MGFLDNIERKNTDYLEAAAQLVETGQFPMGGNSPEVLAQHTANSLRNLIELLENDPEYAKTLGINAQGIAYLHGAVGVLSGLSGK
ncbi:hypothetical protein GCM10027417_24080 [Glutamicibacter endophyticus]